MNYLYLLIFSSLISYSAFAGNEKVLIKKDAAWADSKAWSPEGVPTDNDVVYIPSGYSVTVKKNSNLKKADISVVVDGKLVLEDKLWLGENSTVELSTSMSTLSTTSNNALLEIGKTGVVSGDGITIPGPAITTKSASGSFSFITTSFEVMPVRFVSFNVAKVSNGISVQWATAEEINADAFQIERSEDGKTWRTIGKVKAAGNSTNIQSYSFTDKTTLNNIAYYRIRQVDIDGKFVFTDIKTVANQSNLSGTATNVNIVAAGNNVVMNFSKQVKGTVVVRLISFGGQVLAQQTYSQAAQQIIFNKTNVSKGNYIVSVSNNLDLSVSKQIIL
jgi:hypothetical protein